MQNSTKKFLSLLLVFAMLMSFPIVASANTAYDEKFTGTYTRPLEARDTLFSGEDSKLTEWYGDRVNVGQETYSVRQNQYGLNVDGNMIDAKEKTKYTVWLAQYGVASFRFEAPEDGDYIVLTSRNEKYTDKDDMNYWENWINIFNYRKNLRYDEYHNGYTLDSLQYKAKYAYCVYENQYYEGGFFYVSVGAQTDYDCVFDVEILNVKDLTKENCPHYTYDIIYTEENGCTTNYTKKCKICGEEFKTEETNHHWYEKERVEPEDNETDICQNEIFYKEKCSECGSLSSWTWSKHDVNSDSVIITEEYIGYYTISYDGVCKLCGEEFHEYEDSPCYNNETDEYEHDFGDKDLDKVNCKNTAKCNKCGHVYGEDVHDYGDVNWEYVNCKNPAKCIQCGHVPDYHHWVFMADYLNPSHSCFVEKGAMCKICGEKETNSEPEVCHSGWTYVQVTPQYKDHCGTYRMYCEDCGNYITEAAPLHTGTWEYDEKSGKYFMDCTRCGERVSTQDIHPNRVIPGGSSTGGGGGGGFAPAPEEPTTTEPATKPENNTTTTTTTKKPATVTIKKPQSKKKSVVVTWKAEKNVSGYEVQVATDKKFKKNKKSVKINKKKASKKTFKNLKSNKKYYVRVRSYKIVNGKKVYGKWSKVKSVKTK